MSNHSECRLIYFGDLRLNKSLSIIKTAFPVIGLASNESPQSILLTFQTQKLLPIDSTNFNASFVYFLSIHVTQTSTFMADIKTVQTPQSGKNSFHVDFCLFFVYSLMRHIGVRWQFYAMCEQIISKVLLPNTIFLLQQKCYFWRE